MSPTEVGYLGIIFLIVLLFAGVPVGVTMIIVGTFGFALVGGLKAALSNLAILPFDKLSEYSFSVLPLFVLMSAFIGVSGIGSEAYESARAWFGKLRGGLAMATVVACGLFAACAGTSMAGTLVMGKVAYPEMKKLGYSDRLACGCISAGGTLGILIPPSTAFVLIGILSQLSIGRLLISGILPGIMVIICYVITIAITTKFYPALAPGITTSTLREKLSSIKLTWPILFIFVLIMGGMLIGIFTPTEAAAIGAFGALVLALARKQMSAQKLWSAMMDSARMTGTMFIMIAGAFIFNAFLATTQLPSAISELLSSLPVSQWIILAIILIFYVICGCFFDILAILILTIPILYPALNNLGFDLIWYSVLMVRIVEIGNITPPFGMNLFAMATVVDVPMNSIFRGVIPFIISDLVNLAILCIFPVISTFLPNLMYGV